MKMYLIAVYVFLSFSANGENLIEENIFKVRSAYLADHVSTLTFKPTDWKVGELKVPAEKYDLSPQGLSVGYSIQIGDNVISDDVKISLEIARIRPSEWMRNPLYTKGYVGLISLVMMDDKLVIESINTLPDKAITSNDLSKIQEYPNGYKTLSENLNASISDNYGDAMVGWLGIRRESNISGAVIFSLLSRTKQAYRSSAAAILVGGKSEIKQEEVNSLIKFVFSEAKDATLAEDVAIGIMASSYCSPWQKDRLCEEARNFVVRELEGSNQKGQVLDFIKSAYKNGSDSKKLDSR